MAVTLKQLEIEQKDTENRLAAIGGMEPSDYTDETRAELQTLRTTLTRNGDQQIALKLAGNGDPEPIEKPTETPEDNRLLELRSELQFGRYVAAAYAGRAATGREAEYNAEMGIAENKFPMELLARSAMGPLETRAKRDGDGDTNQGSWLDRVFYDSAAMRVGISFRDAGPGIQAYPVTTAGGSGAQRGREQATAESTYTVVVTEIAPSRHAVHGVYTIEDAARLPGLADAIERDMRNGIVDSVDIACFKGDNGADENTADVVGMQTATGLTEITLTQAQSILAADTLGKFVGLVDGRYARSNSELRIVSSVGANTLWYGTIANSTASNDTIARFLMENGLTWMARGDIDTATEAGDFGAYIGLENGIDGAGIAAVWNSGEMVVDRYSGAKKGEVELTLNYMWQLAFPRVANFKRLKFVA